MSTIYMQHMKTNSGGKEKFFIHKLKFSNATFTRAYYYIYIYMK